MKTLPKFLSGAVLGTALVLCLGCRKDEPGQQLPGYEEEVPQDQETENGESGKLKGTVIGTAKSMSASGQASTTANTREKAFDSDYNTYFTSYESNRTWVGLDLGSAHVITKVGFAPRIGKESLSVLGLFEGANTPSFSDALPLAIVRQKGKSGSMQYMDVNCSKGFRYVRYVGPDNSRCNIAELEFYGVEGEGDNSRFCQLTNLPTVVINTENASPITSKEVYVNSNVYIISDGGASLLSTSDTGVRGRGNASWGFPKKPYRIKFDSKQSPLGAPASAKSWTLISNYGDKTLMRNMLAFEVSRRVGMAYTPFCTPVDVILNGEYQGCYQFCDQVEVGTGRVPAKDGYLIEIDAYAYDEEVNFVSDRWMPVTVKYPKDDEITGDELAAISGFFNKMEAAVFSENFADAAVGYRKYLDVDSFLRNFIIGEFCGNTDTYWSVYMYKDGADGVLFTGPAWDYDLAFENDGRTYPINDLNGFIYATKGSVPVDAVRSMVTRIVRTDPAGKARLQELWNELKPRLEDLNACVDSNAALLEESQQLNFKRWPILSTRVHENPVARGSYPAEVDAVKSYITARLSKFDELVK
ncbi:MAG: CotH kinase family protein [Bacteroidales bacterium]|nr:CotH kinase family protein [Bacteroidales bacterium]